MYSVKQAGSKVAMERLFLMALCSTHTKVCVCMCVCVCGWKLPGIHSNMCQRR